MDFIIIHQRFHYHLKLFLCFFAPSLFLLLLLFSKLANNFSKLPMKNLNYHTRITSRSISLYLRKSKYKNITLKEYKSQQILLLLNSQGNWNFVEDYSGINGWIPKNRLKVPKLFCLLTKRTLNSLNNITIPKNTKLFIINFEITGPNIILECLVGERFRKIILNSQEAKEQLW